MSTRFTGKWLVLSIDLITVAVSFFLAYLIRFNFNLNFDMSNLVIQLPVVVLITWMAFLITGSYKGAFRYTGALNVSNIFKTTCLSCVLVFLLIMVNRAWGIYPKLSIPLSIIIIFCLLSFVGLTASRYVYKVLYDALVNKSHK